MQVEMKLTGDREAIRKLGRLAKSYPDATAAALYQEGFGILAPAVRYAPVEFSVLRSSGYVSPPTGVINPVVEVGFGTDYAVYVHERTGLHHPRGGGAKFLEKATNEATSGYAERLAKRIVENEANDVKAARIPKAAPTKPPPADVLRAKREAMEKAKRKREAKARRLAGNGGAR